MLKVYPKGEKDSKDHVALNLKNISAEEKILYFTLCIIDRGGSNIEGAAANDTLATNNQCVTLIYANATKGWLYKSTNQ